MTPAPLLLAFVLGISFTLVYLNYRGMRSATGLVGRVFLLPFYALATLSNVLLCLAVWLMTGDSFSVQQDSTRREKHSSWR